MSGIAVVYNLDGRPVERQLFAKMLTAIAHRGPDGLTKWIGGPVGLGHAMLATTLEAQHEREPLVDDTVGICLTFDGRVDNRQELSKTLAGKGFRLRDDTDAELVLRAYECWGEDSPEKIIGDFAYVIWDSRRLQLFLRSRCFGGEAVLLLYGRTRIPRWLGTASNPWIPGRALQTERWRDCRVSGSEYNQT